MHHLVQEQLAGILLPRGLRGHFRATLLQLVLNLLYFLCQGRSIEEGVTHDNIMIITEPAIVSPRIATDGLVVSGAFTKSF